LEHVGGLQGNAEAVHFGAHATVALVADCRSKRGTVLQHAVLNDPGCGLHRIYLAEIELHHERLRAFVRTVERGRKARVVSLEEMNRASEIDGIVFAADSPHGAARMACQAAE